MSIEISRQHGVVAECSPALRRSVRWILVQYLDILSEHYVLKVVFGSTVHKHGTDRVS